MHAADTASEKVTEIEEGVPKAEKGKHNAASEHHTGSTAADKATKTPLPPSQKLDSPGSNGSHKAGSVSTGTQTDPLKPAKGSEKTDGAASWSQPGTAQTGWDDADPASKPGILGVHQASCLRMPLSPLVYTHPLFAGTWQRYVAIAQAGPSNHCQHHC